jgi:hypothetical protein
LWGMWLGGKKKVYTICCNFLAFETGLSYDWLWSDEIVVWFF